MKKWRNNITKRLLNSRMFLQNFLCLMGILTCTFMVFALIIFSQSRNTLKKEFTEASQFKLEETALAIDQHIMDMRYIIATLDTNNMVRAFFSHQNPEAIYDDYYTKLQTILQAYVSAFPSMHSVYLYSENTGTILSSTSRTKLNLFSDISWTKYLGNSEESFQIIFRAVGDSFPFVLTILKEVDINGYTAVFVINVDLSKLAQLAQINETPYQSVYLVSDDGQIVFRNGQRAISEPLSTIPELINFYPETDFYTELIDNDTAPYTYTQKHSENYPWSYVIVTHLQEYTSRLSSTKAMFIAVIFSLFCAVFLLSFLFSLRSVKPIRNLLQLLQNPELSMSPELYSDKEISYIADQITSNIQKNQALSDELSARLNLLNQTKLLALQSQINPHFLFNTLNMIHIQESEELGYNHPIPKLTLGLSRLLRYSIESTDLVSLETELEFTKMYINILRERYNNKPIVVYDIDPATFQAKVPKLFIQPIIENAVFHGLAEHMNEQSTLTLSCHQEEHICVLSVKDNGVGMKPEVLAELKETLKESVPLKNSIGIKNVVTRMNLLYGEEFNIDIESTEGEGSVFILCFPFLE